MRWFAVGEALRIHSTQGKVILLPAHLVYELHAEKLQILIAWIHDLNGRGFRWPLLRDESDLNSDYIIYHKQTQFYLVREKCALQMRPYRESKK